MAWLLLGAAAAFSQDSPIIIRTSTLFDGRGAVLKDTAVVVRGPKIARLEPSGPVASYDLRGLTVVPGFIDTHVHGVTTVQSLGSASDLDLREAVARGVIPGPRVLTSIRQINESTGGPDQLREAVRKLKAEGADVVKIFASKSIRDGGGMTMTAEQLEAACGEARAQGLRAIVHAHGPDSIKAATRAGCSQIEHGVFADQEALRLMAERGVYFDSTTR